MRENDKKQEPSCYNCTHHNYDWDTEGPNAYDEYEIYEKGNDLEGPCHDWEKF